MNTFCLRATQQTVYDVRGLEGLRRDVVQLVLEVLGRGRSRCRPGELLARQRDQLATGLATGRDGRDGHRIPVPVAVPIPIPVPATAA